MPVAVAHDATPEGRAAVAEALKWAQVHDTSVIVLHVVEAKSDDAAAQEASTVQEQVTAVADGLGPDAPTWEVRTAPAARGVAPTLLEMLSQSGAETVVVGSRRRTEVGKFLMGGTVQRVLLDSPVPVLVVKTN